jgi:hypothetical protein
MILNVLQTVNCSHRFGSHCLAATAATGTPIVVTDPVCNSTCKLNGGPMGGKPLPDDGGKWAAKMLKYSWGSGMAKVTARYAKPFDVAIPPNVDQIKKAFAHVTSQKWCNGMGLTGSILSPNISHKDIDIVLFVNDVRAYLKARKQIDFPKDIDGLKCDIFIKTRRESWFLTLDLRDMKLYRSGIYNLRNVDEKIKIVDVADKYPEFRNLPQKPKILETMHDLADRSTGGPAVTVSTSDCNGSSSSTGDPCNFAIYAADTDNSYNQTFDISGIFSAASTVNLTFYYNSFTVPDQFTVTGGRGNVIFDSGCVATHGELNTTFSVSSQDNPITIQVDCDCGEGDDSGWYWRMSCESVTCTPTVPLAPNGSLMTPTEECSGNGSNITDATLLWQQYQVTPPACNCQGYAAVATGLLTYNGTACQWASNDTPPWILTFDGSVTWTLSRGGGNTPIIWTGTYSGLNPINTFTRINGSDSTVTRTITIPCQTCPSSASDCCDTIQVAISGACTAVNGLWTMTRYANEPFWSSGNTGGAKPSSESASGVALTLRCDGYHWVLQTYGDNSQALSYIANLTDCPSLNNASWSIQNGTCGGVTPSLSFTCAD